MLDRTKLPRHIGIIMDGNRRFARRLMKTPWKGHELGKKKVEEVLDWCFEYDIHILTLYAFSMENFSRPKDEFEFLMKLFEEAFLDVGKDERVHKNKVKINVFGRVDLLPAPVQKAINKAIEATKDYSNYILNFAVAYGGRHEIADAARKISEKVAAGEITPNDVDLEMIDKNLYSAGIPDPDLIIRTSGEFRTSGFLPWQAAYSELYFTKKFWPEFSKEDFVAALEDYQKRRRRFGA